MASILEVMMEVPSLNLSSEKISVYRSTALRLHEQQQPELLRLQEQAWEVARRAASILKQNFHATRVVVFGSLAHEGCFTRWSDVDIAAWGISPEDTFRAIGALMDIDSSIEINLVDVNSCRPSLVRVIEQEGIEV